MSAPSVQKFIFDLEFDDDTPHNVEPVNPTTEPMAFRPVLDFDDDQGLGAPNAGDDQSPQQADTPPSAAKPDTEPTPTDGQADSAALADDAPQDASPQEEHLEKSAGDGDATADEKYLEKATGDDNAAVDATAPTDALSTCAKAMASLATHFDQLREEMLALSARVAIEICRKMLPHTADVYVCDEIVKMVSDVVPDLVKQPHIVARIHPSIANMVRSRLAETAATAGLEERLTIVEDAALAPTDASMEWDGGGIERAAERLWARLDALTKRNIPAFSRSQALDVARNNSPQRPNAPRNDPAGEASSTTTPSPDPHANDSALQPDAEEPSARVEATEAEIYKVEPSL